MTTDHRANDLTCDAFAGVLPAFLERELGAEERAAVEAHAASCAECGALLADLQRLTREAAALPLLEPSRDLWAGIEARIEAPVVPLEAPGAPARRRFLRHPALAAAALVFVTAGVTYVATRAAMTPAGTPAPVVARTAPAPEPTDAAASSAQLAEGQAMVTANDSLAAITAVASVDPPLRPRPGLERSGGARLVDLGGEADAAAAAVDSVYGREIARLRALISKRNATLDPATVAVIEQNLGIIDSAIVRSRAALARDPASGFLAGQLTSALEKKVELLRTVATLPARS